MLLLYKQGAREIKRLIHPNAVIPIKIGRKPVGSRVIEAVWGFLAAYILTFAILMLLCMALGENPITAYSAVGACLNNLGPGLGNVASNYAGLSDGTKYILSFAMLLGRLELFTLIGSSIAIFLAALRVPQRTIGSVTESAILPLILVWKLSNQCLNFCIHY